MNDLKKSYSLLSILLTLLIATLWIAGCAKTASTNPADRANENRDQNNSPSDIGNEPAGLNASIEVQETTQQSSNEPIMVKFTLKNNAEDPIYVLKWYTPLEGIAGDIFQVTRDGKELPYIGILAYRAAPTAEDYVFLDAGETAVAEVNIAEAYDFSQPGTYTIKFRSPRISHIALSKEEMAVSLDELGPVNIPSNQVKLEVIASGS